LFPQVAAIGEVGVLSGKRYGNMVLAASLSSVFEFESQSLGRALRSLPTPAKVLFGAELDRFIGTI